MKFNLFKRIIFSCFIFMISCTVTSVKDNDNNQNSVKKEYTLPEKKHKAWDKIREQWFRNEYRACMKKYNLNMNCGNCVYVYIDVVLTIDGKGKLKNYTIIKDNICRKKLTEEIEKCFMEYFENLTYPDELKNTIFEAKLGTGLKC